METDVVYKEPKKDYRIGRRIFNGSFALFFGLATLGSGAARYEINTHRPEIRAKTEVKIHEYMTRKYDTLDRLTLNDGIITKDEVRNACKSFSARDDRLEISDFRRIREPALICTIDREFRKLPKQHDYLYAEQQEVLKSVVASTKHQFQREESMIVRGSDGVTSGAAGLFGLASILCGLVAAYNTFRFIKPKKKYQVIYVEKPINDS